MSVVKDTLNKIEVALENDMEVYIGKIERLESLLNQYTQYLISMLEKTDQSEQWTDEFVSAKERFKLVSNQIPKLEAAVVDYEARARQIDEYVKQLV